MNKGATVTLMTVGSQTIVRGILIQLFRLQRRHMSQAVGRPIVKQVTNVTQDGDSPHCSGNSDPRMVKRT